MFTGMELSRISRAVVQGKPACLQSALVAPSHARFGKRVIRRREQPFRGTNTAQVKAAAAESDAPTPAAAGRERRQPRAAPTVDIATVKPGDVLDGTVRSVESYGAFVDIGAASDGLVHISQLAEGFVKSAQDVVKVGQAVKVKVLSVDANSGKMALTMKGMGMRPAGAAPGRGRFNRGVEEEQPVEEEDPTIEPYDVLLESGLLFRDQALYAGDDARDAALDEGYDPEGDDYVFTDDPLVSLPGELVTGTVKAVDAGGLTVEFEHAGQTFTGFLPVDELMVPAAAAEADAEAAGDKLTPIEDGDEGEYLFDAYEDIGGVDDPAKYYKVGDSISAFAEVNPEDRSITLTHFNPTDADDMLVFDEDEGEVEEVEDEGALLLDRLEAEASATADEPAADGEGEEAGAVLDSRTLTAELYYEQSRTYPTSAGQAFLNGSKPPLAFPQRPMRPQLDSALKVPQSVALTEDDDGEASELIDFWSLDSTNQLPKGALKKLGYKIVKNEESGEWEAVKRDNAPDLSSMELYDMLNMVDDRAVESIVDDILAEDDDEEEAELPFLAMRRPGSIVAAMAVGPIIAATAAEAAISAADVKALRTKTGAGMMDCKKALKECDGDAEKAVEWLRQKGLSGADKKAGRVAAEGAVVRYIHPGNRLGVLLEVNCETDFVAKGDAFLRLANELAMVAASCDAVCTSIEEVPAEILAKEREVEMGKEDLKSKPEAVRAKIVEGRMEKLKRNYALLEQPALRDNNKTVAEVVKETIAATGENIQVRRFVKYNLGEGLEKKSNDFAAEVAQQTQAKAAAPPAPKKEEKKEEKKAEEPKKAAVAVSAAQVKQLRDKSGAGMMDCKKALGECGGDMEAASEWLRKKGLASADKKSGRLAAEGAVLGYIHPGSRLGVLLEVNCETDFVARSEPFIALVNSLAMQIAASPSMEYVTADEIPADVFEAEKAIEMGREDLQSKPEAIRAKIAEGRVKKMVQERVLLDQPYLMDQNKTVGEAIKEAVAAIGENIQVRRFSRFVLGEGIEKKVTDLAAEVAAATGAKA